MTRTRSTKAARQKATKKHRSPTVTTAALVGGVGAAGLLLVVARRGISPSEDDVAEVVRSEARGMDRRHPRSEHP